MMLMIISIFLLQKCMRRHRYTSITIIGIHCMPCIYHIKLSVYNSVEHHIKSKATESSIKDIYNT